MNEKPSEWTARVRDLQALGMTYAQIAEALDAPASTIGTLAAGKTSSPRGDLALRLHTLHAQKMAYRSNTPQNTTDAV